MSFAAARPEAAPVTSFAITTDSNQPQPIKQSHAYTERLQSLVHSISELQKGGYVIHQLSGQDLDRKRRCHRCNRRKSCMDTSASTFNGILSNTPSDLPNALKRVKWLPKTPVQGGNGEQSDEQQSRLMKQTVMHCKYHPGRVFQRVC